MLDGIVDPASSAFLIIYQSLGDSKPLAWAFTSFLNIVFKSKRVKFFQLRLKKESIKKKTIIAKKILRICKKHNVKLFTIEYNDNQERAKINQTMTSNGYKQVDIDDSGEDRYISLTKWYDIHH